MRLVTDGYMAEHLADDKSPGFAAEVIRRIFADLGQDVSLEQFPLNRAWRMVLRGEREGVLITERTHEREQICSFPDEPLVHDTWVLFVRTADAGKLKFSSFEDLIGHNVAVFEPTPGIFEQTNISLELWEFLRDHHNLVEAGSYREGLAMLVAGRVDYVVDNLNFPDRAFTQMERSGMIQPELAGRVVGNGDLYVCFSKARVSPSLVVAFSRALRQFKQTEAYRAMYEKYFPRHPLVR